MDVCWGGVRLTVAQPALALDFMQPGALPSGVTFTRASTATYFDSAGAMQTATANTPRWDYDPVTYALRGLLIEEQRTNLPLNSATLVTQSVTVAAQVYTLSFYGTGTLTLSGVSTAGPLTGTGTQRVALTFTPTAGILTLTVTGTVQNAQLEAGAFPTSYIPTAGALATRSADNCTYVNAGLFGGTTARSLSVDAYALQNTIAGVNAVWLNISDGTANNIMSMLTPASSSNIRYSASVGGVTQYNTGDTTTGVRPVLFKAALSHGVVWNGAINGAIVAGSGGASLLLPNLTTMNIGVGGSLPINGYIRRAQYWASALSVAELQAVTR